MKLLLATLLCYLLAVSATTLPAADFQFASHGLEGAEQWTPPLFNGSTCIPPAVNQTSDNTTSTDNVTTISFPFKSFSLSLEEDTFIRFIALVSERWSQSGRLFFYNGTFNPQAPCEGLVLVLNDLSAVNNQTNVEFAIDLSAGEYTFVFSLEEGNETVPAEDDELWIFLSIYRADFVGSIEIEAPSGNATSNNTWLVPLATPEELGGPANASCALNQTTEVISRFFLATFSVEEDDLPADDENKNKYDILAYLQDPITKLILEDPVIALYQGNVREILATSNASQINPCEEFANLTLIKVVQGKINELTTRLTATLVPGEIYSVIVSGRELTDAGTVAIFLLPSIVYDLSEIKPENYTLVEFSEPSANATEGNCTLTDRVTLYWDEKEFTARFPTAVIKVSAQTFEPFIALYTSDVAASNISDSCQGLLAAGRNPLFVSSLTVGQSYRVVVAPEEDPASFADSEYLLWILTGNESGGISPTGLTAPTNAGLETHVDVATASAAGLSVCLALLASAIFAVIF